MLCRKPINYMERKNDNIKENTYFIQNWRNGTKRNVKENEQRLKKKYFKTRAYTL